MTKRAASTAQGFAAAWPLLTAIGSQARQLWDASRTADRPVATFVHLSLVIGLLLILAIPPMRGPDEGQHFMRAYGLAMGDLLPATEDPRGRKGLYWPASLDAEFSLFNAHPSQSDDVNTIDVMRRYRHLQAARQPEDTERLVFQPYAGAESYAPIPYLPYVAASLVARVAGLDLVASIYLMRLFGLIALTAICAYAIALSPCLRWAFVAILLLPAAVYGRSIISADGGAMAAAAVVAALCLRAAFGEKGGSARRALWMVLCALGKPPQLAFVLLEAMARPVSHLIHRWRSAALIILPAVAAAFLWNALSAADVAAWRLANLTGAPLEQFSPMWKLGYMLENPLHFPRAALALCGDIGELWWQLIGVLGLLDTTLRGWVYPTVSLLLMGTFMSRIDLPPSVRLRIAAASLLAIVLYIVAVALIFYLVWTPIDSEKIWGVQGRYFLPIVPLVAIAVAALLNIDLPRPVTVALAVAAGLLSGAASIEAILRKDWNLFG